VRSVQLDRIEIPSRSPISELDYRLRERPRIAQRLVKATRKSVRADACLSITGTIARPRGFLFFFRAGGTRGICSGSSSRAGVAFRRQGGKVGPIPRATTSVSTHANRTDERAVEGGGERVRE
jgi:hypothetical protein